MYWIIECPQCLVAYRVNKNEQKELRHVECMSCKVQYHQAERTTNVEPWILEAKRTLNERFEKDGEIPSKYFGGLR